MNRVLRHRWPRVALVGVLAVALVVGGGRPSPIQAAAPATPPVPAASIVPGQILVKFRFDLDPTVGRLAAGALAAAPDRKIDALKVHRFSVPRGEEPRYVDQFRQNPLVEYAEPDYQVSAAVLPNDPGVISGTQWYLPKIDAPAAWDVTTGGENSVTVALLDTGIDSRHPDLQDKVLPGYDVSTRQTIPVGTNTDQFSHGTHVAGILAAQTNNGIGVAGVTWSAKLLPVKVLDATGYGSYSDVSEGIVWAVDNGAKVLNMSLGGPAGTDDEVKTIRAAIDYAWDRGAIMVAAAGNEGTIQPPQIDYPGAIDKVISVASTETNDTRSSFSNYNEFVDVAAPGRSIYSTLPNGTYGNKSGTSMATPIVSGIAALLLSLEPSLTPQQVTRRIISSTVDLGPAGKDIYFGWGRVSAARAVLSTAIDVEQSRVTVLPGATGSATLTITGNGAGTVDWQAVSDVPWLKVTGDKGAKGKISAQGTSRVTITPDFLLAPSDAISGTIQVGALLGSELITPQTVEVDLIRGRLLLPGIQRDNQR